MFRKSTGFFLMSRETIKSLEACILGIISARAPCTPYQVVKSFANSPSLFYSGGEGSVYPAIKRLEKAGLIASKQVGTTARPAKGYRLTKKGRDMYKTWYFSGRLIADGGFDPLRLRISLLDSLTATERTAVMEEMIRAICSRIEESESMAANSAFGTTAFFALQMEQVILRAKLDLLRKWKANGVSFETVASDFSVLEKENESN